MFVRLSVVANWISSGSDKWFRHIIADFTHSGKRGADEWYCNICTPRDSTHVQYFGARAAQHHERHSVDHARNVAESEMWWNPPALDAAAWNAPITEDTPLTTEEMKMRESRLHVDHVQDMVPFWIRGVEAAERGEVLRLEEFLETLQVASDAWLNAALDNPWTDVNPDQGWGGGIWDIHHDEKQGLDKDYGWDFKRKADAWGVHAGSLSSADGSIDGIDVTGNQQRQRGGAKRAFNLEKHPPLADIYDFVEEIAKQEAVGEERKRRMHAFFNMSTHEKVKKIREVIQYLNNVSHQNCKGE